MLAAALALLPVAAGAATPKTLTFCSEGAPESFNPMLGSTGTTFDANRPIYDRLVEFRPGTTLVMPALAQRWDISPDGRVYTFHLRRNAAWQSNDDFRPSRSLNADDVIFSFERQWKDANSYHTVSGGHYVYFGYMGLADLLDTIEKVDDLTVRFTLKRPYAPFLADLAMDFAAIQSKEYADTLARLGRPEQIDQQPIGTGPFQLAQYQPGTAIRYQAFRRSWGIKPKVDSLVFLITKDAGARVAKLREGECQVTDFPDLSDLSALRADPKLQVLSGPGLDVGYIAINTTKKPFDDVRVRVAINMAIDRKAILAAVYQGAGIAAKTLLPPTLWAYNAAIPEFRHDPAAAKKMLADAGFKDGFSTDLWAMPVQRPYNPDGKRMADMVQADLAKLGIKAAIASDSWDDYRRRAQEGEPSLAELGWIGDNGDPDNFLTPLAGCDAAQPGGSNIARWCDKGFDDLLKKAAVLPDQAARARLYQQAAVILHKDAPFILMAHSLVFMPMARQRDGLSHGPAGDARFFFGRSAIAVLFSEGRTDTSGQHGRSYPQHVIPRAGVDAAVRPACPPSRRGWQPMSGRDGAVG